MGIFYVYGMGLYWFFLLIIVKVLFIPLHVGDYEKVYYKSQNTYWNL